MSYKLVIAEKPSVAQSIAKVIGADKREDGYLEGNGYIVSWCVGHLVELAPPESYDEKYEKWRYEDLPILPSEWNYQIAEAKCFVQIVEQKCIITEMRREYGKRIILRQGR